MRILAAIGKVLIRDCRYPNGLSQSTPKSKQFAEMEAWRRVTA
jgi:hypothetical protein